jgi:flavodoxin
MLPREVQMRVVVVYESMFGNTKTIAEAIANGLGEAGEVTLGTVDDLSPEVVGAAGLVVAGGPTHGHGMARPDARQTVTNDASYAKYGPVLAGQESLRGWLEHLPTAQAPAAAFDTRFAKPRWLTGSAATKIAQRLRGKGYKLVGTESFFVQTTGGPLADGERERATAWGRQLAANLKRTVAG